MIIFVFFNKKQSDQTLLKSLVSRWSLRYHNVTVMVWITFHICPDLIRNISLWVGNHCVNIGGKDQTAGKFGTTVTFSSRLYLQQQYKFEPQFDKTNKNYMCAHRRLISAWTSAKYDQSIYCSHEETSGPSLPNERTGRVPRLIWVFAGRTGHFVGFAMLRF